MGQQRFYHKANVDPETNEGKDQRSGLIILQKTKDLMKYLYTTWTKYPRSEKAGLRNRLQEMSIRIFRIHYRGTKEVFQENDTSRRGYST